MSGTARTRHLSILPALLLTLLLAACKDTPSQPAPQPQPDDHTPAVLQIIGGNQQRAGAGHAVADSLAVRVTDSKGRPVSGIAVAWAATAGAGTVSPQTSTTNAAGEAKTLWTLGPVAGPNGATASAAALTPAAFSATAQGVASSTITGVLRVPAGAAIAPTDLNVVTFAGSAGVQVGGEFSVPAPRAENYQLVMFNAKEGGNPVFLGLREPGGTVVSASDSSTALALTLLNPYLIDLPHTRRAEYLAAVARDARFDDLLDALGSAYASNPRTALAYDQHPRIYQLASQVMRGAMASLGGVAALHSMAAEGPNHPYLQDVPGDPRVRFVNPRHVYYGAAVVTNAQLREVVSVRRTETLLEFSWGWPPVRRTDPAVTEYALGDGDFELRLARGLDFSNLQAANADPAARATILNGATGVLYIVELLVGALPKVPLLDLPRYLSISAPHVAQLNLALARGDAQDFLLTFLDVVAENGDEIAYWVWQDTGNQAAVTFIRSAAGMLGRITFVMEVLGFANEEGPFFWDLVLSPRELTLRVTQTAGTIGPSQRNDPPRPSFTVAPPAGIVGTAFQFDAGATTDDHDALASLRFRWDWQSDGVWDTDWTASRTASHSYAQAGAYTVTMAARDGAGLFTTTARTVNVGGGAGSASHVKVFRGNLPWDSHATEKVLQQLGFRPGTGAGTYEIIGTAGLGTTPLVPGEDLVIISNDQSQEFYNEYARHQVRFANFVYAGGSMLWEACDEGWAEGSLLEAGVVLPGNVGTELDYDGRNTVVAADLPLMQGLPRQMDHNYASHESFSSLPDGTTVYMVNEEGKPTLIEFSLGAGWLIVTGQPLEHQYDRVFGAPDMERLLPRIVAYFTGHADGAGLARLRQVQQAEPGRPLPAGDTRSSARRQ